MLHPDHQGPDTETGRIARVAAQHVTRVAPDRDTDGLGWLGLLACTMLIAILAVLYGAHRSDEARELRRQLESCDCRP